MKLSTIFIVSVAIILDFTSCKPIYKCGEPKPANKLFVPKIIQTVIDERDVLCSTLASRDSSIIGLHQNIESLNSEIDGLKKQYNDLTNQNLTQSQQFSMDLKKKSDEIKQKTEELKEKEKLIQERENALQHLQSVIAHQDSITKRLNDILRDALLGFKSDELSVEIKNGKVYVSMSDKLLFKSGSASIETKGVEAIKVLAGVIDKNSDIDILIEGHTDNIPIKTSVYRDNWDLSVARAISIVHILIDDYKIAPTRLTASGKGEFSPKVSNATPEGRSKNRRTEIILSPKLDEIMKLLKTK
jgi:chemotaxis protein MotB